jgi:hypothetical protein
MMVVIFIGGYHGQPPVNEGSKNASIAKAEAFMPCGIKYDGLAEVKN